MQSGETHYHIAELRWRGEAESKKRFDPSSPHEMEYSMGISGVGMLYDYNTPLLTGDFPSSAVIRTDKPKIVSGRLTLDLALEPPKITAELSDFGVVQEYVGQIAPGLADVLLPPAQTEPPPDTTVGEEPSA